MEVIANLVFDEMAIHKNIAWTGERFVGCIDFGTDFTPDDSTPAASQALVFMLVAANSSWKIPIAYFFIHTLTAKDKVNLLKNCLARLYDIDVTVPAVTCDGPTTNFSTFERIGASFKLDHFRPNFPHPSNKDLLVHVTLDPSHMAKLMRNTLGDYKVLINGDGKHIKWSYIYY